MLVCRGGIRCSSPCRPNDGRPPQGYADPDYGYEMGYYEEGFEYAQAQAAGVEELKGHEKVGGHWLRTVEG